MAQMIKNPPAMRETWVQSLDWEDPWGRDWQSTPYLAWRIPWIEAGSLQSLGLQSVRHD